jgi:hypothetical protein
MDAFWSSVDFWSTKSTIFNANKLKRTIECELVLSPVILKNMHTFLGNKLKEYEACYGKIPATEDLEARKKEYQRSKGPDDLDLESLK